jgi:hypothetical protein
VLRSVNDTFYIQLANINLYYDKLCAHSHRTLSPICKYTVYFLLNDEPSVNLALPPVGWVKTVAQESQVTAVWACEKTVVMFKQPGHLTSMKKDLGPWTNCFNLCFLASEAAVGCNKS